MLTVSKFLYAYFILFFLFISNKNWFCVVLMSFKQFITFIEIDFFTILRRIMKLIEKLNEFCMIHKIVWIIVNFILSFYFVVLYSEHFVFHINVSNQQMCIFDLYCYTRSEIYVNRSVRIFCFKFRFAILCNLFSKHNKNMFL